MKHRRHAQPKTRRPARQLILTKGDEVRVVTLRGWMLGGGVFLLLASAFWMAATTSYIFFRDDVLAAVMARQTRMQHAYEDRIAALRLQIDRVTSRQLLDQEAFNARMDELTRRQAAIEARTRAVGGLVDRARQSGLVPVTTQGANDALVTGSLAPRGASDRAARVRATLDAIDVTLDRLVAAQDQTVQNIEARARDQHTRIRAVVAELGLDPDAVGGGRPRPSPPPARTPVAANGVASGLGGPLLFAPGQAASIETIEQRARRAREDVEYLDRLRQGLVVLPLRRPVPDPDISSGFGTRRDPFLGIPAFHSGMDFRGDTGDPVRATAAGTVVSVGRNGGYGLMIEIEHGLGLSTRYAHLSQASVREGQRISPGQVIGAIGSTGRSTGPHLHYETRVEGEAVNPERFVRAGRQLGLW